eukprot:CAMPEP_0196744636 /NCGR_PEP_ID=MMETSP1091-20130531/58404_1 /TAXON_ID=302021 /ORGANISM="Rhodomonas sp., Strain CCMP768" /LENGTH=110 /DNA_ID=CAMNT_0042091215 /DNA_START=26 /DNA_END=355 /DNA_ORIENTATION=-
MKAPVSTTENQQTTIGHSLRGAPGSAITAIKCCHAGQGSTFAPSSQALQRGRCDGGEEERERCVRVCLKRHLRGLDQIRAGSNNWPYDSRMCTLILLVVREGGPEGFLTA